MKPCTQPCVSDGGRDSPQLPARTPEHHLLTPRQSDVADEMFELDWFDSCDSPGREGASCAVPLVAPCLVADMQPTGQGLSSETCLAMGSVQKSVAAAVVPAVSEPCER